MLFIRQGATHKVVLGPAVAVGDGFTPVANLDVATADEAEAILHDNGTVVDISGYTWAAIATADGYYHLTLQNAISGTVGHLTIVVNDDDLVLPLRADFTVLDTAAYDANFKDAAEGPLQATTVGRKLDVESTGEAGLDFNNIKAASGATTLTNITVPTTTAVTNDVTTDAASRTASKATGFSTHNATQVWTQIGALTGEVVADGANDGDAFKTDLGATLSELWKYAVIVFTSGDLAGQSRPVSSYDAGTKFITVAEELDATPAAEDGFWLLPIFTELERGTNSANTTVPDAAGVVATALGDGTVVLAGAYDAAKTAAQAGDLMGLSADAITSAKIADDAFSSEHFAADALAAATFATGALTADAFAADALVAATFATDSIAADALAANALAEINAEVVDALNVDTYAEPGQGAPAATASLVAKIGYLYKNWRNKKEQTSSEFTLYADDGTTADQQAAVADDGTTASKGEMGTGA